MLSQPVIAYILQPSVWSNLGSCPLANGERTKFFHRFYVDENHQNGVSEENGCGVAK